MKKFGKEKEKKSVWNNGVRNEEEEEKEEEEEEEEEEKIFICSRSFFN